MFHRLWPAACLCLGFASPVLAKNPAPPQPAAPQVEQLIEQLGDDNFRTRDSAYEQLQARGVAALPALRKALNHPDAEVRRRVHELIPTLETLALLMPKRVSIKANDRPVKEILDDISRQTGYKIECWSANPQMTYRFDFQNLTFWEALDRVSEEAGLVLMQGYGDEQVRLNQQEARSPYVFRDGAFRFVANGFDHYRSVQFAQVAKNGGSATRNETLTFSFWIYVEPKMPLLNLGQTRLTLAVDNEKNSLVPPVEVDENQMMGRRFVHYGGNGYRSMSLMAQVPLHRVSEKATSVKLLRGTIPVTLLAEQKPIVLTDKVLEAKGKKYTAGNVTIQIEDVSETPNKQYQIRFSVTNDTKDNPNVHDYTWMNSLYQRVELQDAKGNKFTVFGSTWNNSGPNHAQMTFTYGQQNVAKPEPPAKFIFHQWTTLQHQLSFEFKDLPLP